MIIGIHTDITLLSAEKLYQTLYYIRIVYNIDISIVQFFCLVSIRHIGISHGKNWNTAVVTRSL